MSWQRPHWRSVGGSASAAGSGLDSRSSTLSRLYVAPALQSISRKVYHARVGTWSFLTNHARALICIARDPGVRLRALADALGITERRAHGIVTDLTDAGNVVKEKDGRRNRYRDETQRPLRESVSPDRTIGEVLGVLIGADADAGPRLKPRR